MNQSEARAWRQEKKKTVIERGARATQQQERTEQRGGVVMVGCVCVCVRVWRGGSD